MREQKSPYFWLTLTAILGTIITALSIAASPFVFDNPLFPNLPSIAALSGLAVGSVIMAVAAFSVLKRQNSVKGGLSYSVALLAIGADLTLGNYLAGTLEIYYSVAIMAAFAAAGILGLVYSSTQMKKLAENSASPLVEQQQRTDLPEESKDNIRAQEPTIIPTPIVSESKSNQNSSTIAARDIDSNISDRRDSQAQNNSSSSTDTTPSTSNTSTLSIIAPSSVDSRPPSPNPSPIRSTTPNLTDSSDNERTQIDINLETISKLLERARKTEKKSRRKQTKDHIIKKIFETLELGATAPLILQQFKFKKYNSDFIESFIEPFQNKCAENTTNTIKSQIPLILKTLLEEVKKKQKNEVLEAIKIYFDTLQHVGSESAENFQRNLKGCQNIIVAIQDFGAIAVEISLILSNKFHNKTFMQEIISHLRKESQGLSKEVKREIDQLITILDTNISINENDKKRKYEAKAWHNTGREDFSEWHESKPFFRKYSSYTIPNVPVPPRFYRPDDKPATPEKSTKVITKENPPQEEHKKKITKEDIPNKLKEFARTDPTHPEASNIAAELVQSYFPTLYFDDRDICCDLVVAQALHQLKHEHIKFLLEERFWENHKIPRGKVENRVIQILLSEFPLKKETSDKRAAATFVVQNYFLNLTAEVIADHLLDAYTSYRKSQSQHIKFLLDPTYWTDAYETLRKAVEEQILKKTPKPTEVNENKKINNPPLSTSSTEPQQSTRLSPTSSSPKNYSGIGKEPEQPKLLTTFFKSTSPNTHAPKEAKQRISVEQLLDNFSKPGSNRMDLTKELESRLYWHEIPAILVNGIWNNQLTVFDANFIITHLKEPMKTTPYKEVEKAKNNKEELEAFLETNKNKKPYPIQPLVRLLQTCKLTDKNLVNVLNRAAHIQGYICENQIHEIVVRYLELSLQETSIPEANHRYQAILPLLPKKEAPTPESDGMRNI